MAESKEDLDADFDREFSTLSLVNASDMDVYLKVIMSMDKNSSQCLRGELNHIAGKYIDNDPELKKRIQKNKYSEFAIDYLKQSYYLIRKSHIRVLQDKLLNAAMEMLKKSGSIDFVLKSITVYAHNVKAVKNSHLIETNEKIRTKFFKACRISQEYREEFQTIHMCIVDILNIIDPKYIIKNKRINIATQIDMNEEDGQLVGLRYTFCTSHTGSEYLENIIPMQLWFANLDDNIVEQIKSHYAVNDEDE
jgi:hypothetical protein